MITWIFLGFVVLLIVFLCAHEIRRYSQAQHTRGSLVYPRRRLSRRLGIAALLVVILGLVQMAPKGRGAYFYLFWYGLCLIVTIILLILIVRDFHEASLQVVAENQRFKQDAELRIKSAIDEVRRSKDGG